MENIRIRKLKCWCAVLFVAHLLIMSALPSLAARAKLVVVVANRLVLTDLQAGGLPTISEILDKGSVGLISHNCSGTRSEYSVFLTAASGASCRGKWYTGLCFDSKEKLVNDQSAGNAFTARTGSEAGDGAAVFVGLPLAERENVVAGSPVKLNQCGQALRDAGKKTCVIGNADVLPNVYNRAAALLAMDSEGRADIGMLSVPVSKPGEFLTDPEMLAAAAKDGLRRADFVVVNFGDNAKLDDSYLSISDRAYAKNKALAIKNLDKFLKLMLPSLEAENAGVILVSLCPPLQGTWNQLTPIVFYPSNKSGLLTSSSTRTPGLIAASDFTPTVLNVMGVENRSNMMGRKAFELTSHSKFDILDDLYTRVRAKQIMSLPVLWAVVLLCAFSVTLSAVLLAFSLPLLNRIRVYLKIGLLALASAPLGMLVAAAAPGGAGPYSAATVAVVVVTVIFAIASDKIYQAKTAAAGRNPIHAFPIIAVYGLTILVLIIDSAAGGYLCKFSLPSYYQLSGLRFYGIGNEYGAVLIGASGLFVIFSGKNLRKRVVLPVALLIVLFLGEGMFGANYGGTVAAVVTFCLVAHALFRGRFNFLHVVGACVAGALVAVMFAFVDWKTAGVSGTHAGRVTDMVEKIGGGFLVSIAARKMLFNINLLAYKTAQKAFLSFAPFVALWFWGVQNKVKNMFADDKNVISALKGLLVGCVVALLVNDSGVIMAGIMVGMIVVTLLYSLLEEADKPCQES